MFQSCCSSYSACAAAPSVDWRIATGATHRAVYMQLESLPAMVQGVWSEDPKAQLDATSQFRKLLSIGGLTCVCLL